MTVRGKSPHFSAVAMGDSVRALLAQVATGDVAPLQPGDTLSRVARHTDCYFQTLHLSGFAADMLGQGGLQHLVGNEGVRVDGPSSGRGTGRTTQHTLDS